MNRGIIKGFDTKFMHHSDWIWERKNQVPILLGSSVIVLAIAEVATSAKSRQTVAVVSSFDQKERPSLNARELDVLRLVVQGLANKEIASRAEILEGVVKNTPQQLFGKTQVRTRSQLVRVASERYRDLL
jgi:DNA-binding NarL/FixJ family response regulator